MQAGRVTVGLEPYSGPGQVSTLSHSTDTKGKVLMLKVLAPFYLTVVPSFSAIASGSQIMVSLTIAMEPDFPSSVEVI